MDQPDHRRLGRRLGIFATDERCGAGLPLWLPAGAAVRGEIERFVTDLERRHGYQHVYTPELAKRELYEQSGHWEHYRDDMYPPMQVGAEQVVLRPMNCPHHILVFAAEPRRARDLPFRLAELGTMFRFERSGVVGGLSRVRQMTLNDGHVFAATDQVESEIAAILGMVDEAYRALAIPAPSYRLSLKGTGPKYVGDPAVWAASEDMARSALATLGLDYVEAAGEGAFYGPKIDLQVRDPQGREETLSTIQVDSHLPARFGLGFRRGPATEQPVLIHRSIVSTMERMVAHLLEVHAGVLPVWLAPTQVVVLPVVPDALGHAAAVRDGLRRRGLRVELDDRDETLAARVRGAQQRFVPYLAVVGAREVQDATVSVRRRDGVRLPAMGLSDFAALAGAVVADRVADLGPIRPSAPVAPSGAPVPTPVPAAWCNGAMSNGSRETESTVVAAGTGGTGGITRIAAVAVDCANPPALAAFWQRLLGGEVEIDGDGDVLLHAAGVSIIFLRVPDTKVVKNRLHLDLRGDTYETAIAEAVAAGATLADDIYDGDRWQVLRDPEGNEFCILRPSASG